MKFICNLDCFNCEYGDCVAPESLCAKGIKIDEYLDEEKKNEHN